MQGLTSFFQKQMNVCFLFINKSLFTFIIFFYFLSLSLKKKQEKQTILLSFSKHHPSTVSINKSDEK
jgi:hypothetical protein